MGGPMKEAFDKATAAASDFVHEHPTLVAGLAILVAIGILVILVPWAVRALGFAERGPLEGKFFLDLPDQNVRLIWQRFVGSGMASEIP